MKQIEENNNIQDKTSRSIGHGNSDTPPQEALEKPVITIEYYDDTESNHSLTVVNKRSQPLSWRTCILWFVTTTVIVFACYSATRLYNYYYNIGVSISVSPEDNIKKLDNMKAQHGPSEIVTKSDSVLGVALNIHELHNVKAELALSEPDTADHNVLLYTRTADYTPTGKHLGSLVIDGEEKQSDVSRLGYCAIEHGNMVIGISRFDDMKKHMISHCGSYFRQFVLVSNGELPQRFFLHGKVERKALARTADDLICVIETRYPETLWSFADALREYGYVDAIYLTGGNESGFCRTHGGIVNFTANTAQNRTGKPHDVAPWLVIRKR